MSKKIFYFSLGLIVVALSVLIVSNYFKTKPNVLLIISSVNKSNILGNYEGYLVRTTNLDKISNEGIEFAKCYGISLLQSEVVNSVVSGKNTSNKDSLTFVDKSDFNELVNVFLDSGYEIAITGDWRVVSDEHKKYYLNQNINGSNKHKQDNIYSKKGNAIDVFADKIVDFLRTRKKPKPFLILLYQNLDINHSFNVNNLYGDTNKYEDLNYEKNIFASTLNKNSTFRNKSDSNIFQNFHADSLEQINSMRNYFAAILSFDENLGRIIRVLKDKKEFDNTLVIYALIEHNYNMKGFYNKDKNKYSHLPIIKLSIRYPEKIKQGVKSNVLCLSSDIYPTLLDICDKDIPKAMKENTLLPIIRKNGIPPVYWRKSVYFENKIKLDNNYQNNYYGLITDNYKLINHYKINKWELYDLGKDPNELNNVFQYSRYSNIKDSLMELLSKKGICTNNP